MIKSIREHGVKKTAVMVARSTIRVWQAAMAILVLGFGFYLTSQSLDTLAKESDEKINAAIVENCLKVTEYNNADLERWARFFDGVDRRLPDAKDIVAELRAELELMPKLDITECVPPGT